MRALTLTQPWCGLVASGIKLVENRPRPMIKKEDFGKPFGLHASRVIDGGVYQRIRELAPSMFYRRENDAGDVDTHEDERWFKLSQITSAVIAVATIKDALYIGGCNQEAILRALERLGIPKQLRWTFGPTVYVLADEPRVLPQPVPCRGYQGFWTLSADLAALVEAQL